MSTIEWARPLVRQQAVYRIRSLYFNLGILIIIVVFSLVYWFLSSQNVANTLLVALIIGFLAVLLKGFVLKPIELSLPDAYSVHLVRIAELSAVISGGNGQPQARESFIDAVSDLVKQIDIDLDRLKYNLAAWKTIEGLRMLRSFLLKFITVCIDRNATESIGRSREQLLPNMFQTLEMGADFFHRFYSVEPLIQILDADRQNLQQLREYRVRVGSRRMLKFVRKWHSLPPPLNAMLIILAGAIIVWLIPYYDQFNFSARIVSTLTIILGVTALFNESIRRWLRTAVEGAPSASSSTN